mgnify:CR=1 FL=1
MWRRVTDFASTCLHYSPFPTGSNLSSRVYTNWKAPAHVCQHSRTQGPEEVARRYALLFFGFFSAGFFSAGFFTSAGVSGFRADTTIEGIGIMNL